MSLIDQIDSTCMEKNTVTGISSALEPAKLVGAWRQLGPVNWSIIVGQPDHAKEEFNLVDLIIELAFSLQQAQALD